MNIKSFIKLTQNEIDRMTEEFYIEHGSGDIIFAPLLNKEMVIIKTKDILFLQEEKGIIYIKTLKDRFECKFEFYDIYEILENKYREFKFVDNNVMANISNIVAYDSYYNKIYFADDVSINTVSPFIKYLKTSLTCISDLTCSRISERRINKNLLHES